ncbi:hypothetical protein QIW31_04360 [Francisellaceae bacterium CB299]|jgi:hypothetical protein
MYNQFTKEMLSKVSMQDAEIFENQKKYSVRDNFSTVEIYVSDTAVSYRVQGDGYIVAMIKWLQLMLINNKNLKDITLNGLVEIFDLSEVKFRNAVQILELIEMINEI